MLIGEHWGARGPKVRISKDTEKQSHKPEGLSQLRPAMRTVFPGAALFVIDIARYCKPQVQKANFYCFLTVIDGVSTQMCAQATCYVMFCIGFARMYALHSKQMCEQALLVHRSWPAGAAAAASALALLAQKLWLAVFGYDYSSF